MNISTINDILADWNTGTVKVKELMDKYNISHVVVFAITNTHQHHGLTAEQIANHIGDVRMGMKSDEIYRVMGVK